MVLKPEAETRVLPLPSQGSGLPLLFALRAQDPDAEKTRPDAGNGQEGHVCQTTPPSIRELGVGEGGGGQSQGATRAPSRLFPPPRGT